MSMKSVKFLITYAALDIPDYFYRFVTGQRYLPPYSLRAFVGGAKGFTTVGHQFLNDFKGLGLVNSTTRAILDIGCGCGRIAYTLASDSEVRAWKVRYVGMDVDTRCVAWCNSNIPKINERFSFYNVDIFSGTYNPKGKHRDSDYEFPFPDAAFDLIILTSVFTHMLESGIRNYCREIFRLLTEDGTAYASCFVYRTKEEAVSGVERKDLKFKHFYGDYAVQSTRFPETAVAFREEHLKRVFEESGLCLRMPPRYGFQDLFLLKKK